MPDLHNRDEELLSKIRTAVREHQITSPKIDDAYPLNDMTIDFIEEDMDGTRKYEVYGDTTAIIYGPKRAPDDWDEFEVDCTVNLEVSIDVDGGIEVETKEVMVSDEEPWDNYPPEVDYDETTY